MGSASTLGSLGAQSSLLESKENTMMRGLRSPGALSDDAKIDKGAREFEAILVGNWLQQAEQSFATVPGADDDEDPGKGQMMNLGVQQLATAIARNGSLGIGTMIAKAMHANADKEKTHSAQTQQFTGTSTK